MPHLYEVFRQRNVSVVLGGAADWVEPVLLRLESIAREEAPDYELYESECLTQLMTLLLTKKPERGGHASGETLQKWEQIHQYLEEHFAEKITLEDLGKRFSVSKYYMLRGFKRRYGVTIVQFINQCRMNYAKNERDLQISKSTLLQRSAAYTIPVISIGSSVPQRGFLPEPIGGSGGTKT